MKLRKLAPLLVLSAFSPALQAEEAAKPTVLFQDPSSQPTEEIKPGVFDERYRLFADINGDENQDLILSEGIGATFGTGGGPWQVYLSTSQGYERVGEFGGNRGMISIERLVRYDSTERSVNEPLARIWSYSHISARAGVVNCDELSSEGLKTVQSLEVNSLDSDTDLTRKMLNTIFDKSPVSYRLQESQTNTKGEVTWKDAAQPTPSPHVPAGYGLVWNDEFSGQKLDTAKWGFPSYKVRENAQMNTPGTVTLNDEGHLVLSTLFKDGQVHCSYVQTRSKFEPKYGYFESRIRFQKHQGHHGCFWLQTKSFGTPPDDPAKAGTEMDIIEWFGAGRVQGWAGMNIYYGGGKDGKVRSPSIPDFSLMGGPPPDGKKPSAPLGDLSSGFRTYGLLWTAEKCEFFCDGVKIMEDTKAVSQIPEFIVLSLLSSGWERARLDTAKLPDSMSVDYVRVYAPAAPKPASR